MSRAQYPDNVSPRDRDGHDAGRIHSARVISSPTGTGTYRTACGQTIGQYGTVSHGIGPTCRACKRIME